LTHWIVCLNRGSELK